MILFVPENILLAVGSALAWGGGDFSGGMGVRSVGGSPRGALQVVLLSHVTSLTLLLLAACALHRSAPHGALLAWGLAAGVIGCISITAFYVALSRGEMGGAAAVSGLLAAAIPALLSAWNEGLPTRLHLAGFVVAGVSIWLIAAGEQETTRDRLTVALAIGAGAGFGLYFVCLRMAGPAGPVWAMASARIGSGTTCGLLLLAVRPRGRGTAVIEGLNTLRWILLTALLDTVGNMLFVAATQAGRLDTASVLASMYPAGTILLAAWMLKERPGKRQLWGMTVAFVAVVMITL